MELITPFFIDNGELNGLDNKKSFCLGVEFGRFIKQVEADEQPDRIYISHENIIRVKEYLCWRNIKYEIKKIENPDNIDTLHYTVTIL